jgi:ATP-dependent RNA helicase DHX8/PRP22
MQAAVTVARRVASEKKVELGQEVGYAVRFEDRTSRRTCIKYLTGGRVLADESDSCCTLRQQRLQLCGCEGRAAAE